MDQPKKKLTPVELWTAIENMEANDEAERILALDDAALDAEIAAGGGDPKAIREEGVAFVAKLVAARDERDWEEAAARKLAAVRAKIASRPKTTHEKLPRVELLARIASARANPKFAQPVSVMFRKHNAEQASDEELAALLEEIEALAEHEE